MRLLLVRHAETAWNRERRYQGRTDTPLSEAGLVQAEQAARAMTASGLKAVYSSPLRRARETAAAIAKPHGLDVRVTEAFGEIHFGRWEGLTLEEARALDPAFYDKWLSAPDALVPPGGEALADMRARALAGLESMRAEHADVTICLVTHAMVARVLILEALGLPLDRMWSVAVGATGISELEFRPDWTALHRMNTRMHLEGVAGA